MPRLLDNMDVLKCGVCGYVGDFMDYEAMGSCKGSVFCPRCNSEIDSLTGQEHEECDECISKCDPLFNLMGDLINTYWDQLTIVEEHVSKLDD